MTASDVSLAPDAVAIVGMAGRFPGARGLDEFWRNLRDGIESIRFFSDEELAAAGIAAHVYADPAYVKARGELADIELFDAGLFGFTPREAEIADPQQRIFLECVWQALEDAGYDPARFRGDIGLFGGASMNLYLINNLLGNRRLIDAMGLLQTAIFNRNDHLTTHTAYKLNLKGPSVTVQTTCSTSLVAVHMACQALTGYHCDMALAGGVAVPVPNRTGYLYQEGGIGSPDGHCRAFDARANGTVSGSGAGVVALKRLSDALADGDSIRAVIRSSAINNDGAEKIGYTAPSVAGQAQAIAMAQAIAGISPERISYIEAHGTGTSLGDPIEIEALTQVFRRATARKGFCAIGSVKTNIGHLDTAAGIAGLIKTTLALQHRQLPASLHFSAPNPRIDFAGSPFRVNAELRDWDSDGQPRMAGVSSFGIGGTNAHVIVEEAPPPAPRPASARPQLLTLSARSKAALNTMVAELSEHLRLHPQQDLADVAYTLQVGRRALGQRCAFVCRDREDAQSVLAMADVGRMASGTKEAAKRPVAFMFPGQGSQYVNAAVELYRTEEVFRRELDRCAQLLRPYLDAPLQELLFAPPERAAEASARLQQTAVAQPALFAVEYALARLFMQWGVQPQAMIGHSVGEYVAACLSGVFSLEDALKLVTTRGRLMQALPGGGMLSVSLSEHELRPRLGRGLEIAAINSPSLCVVAGRDEAIAAFEAELVAQGVGCLRLRTSHAFHSSMMEPILEEFVQAFDGVELQPPTRPYLSTLTGAWITPAEATSPEYWARHLRHPVQFGKGLGVLFEDPAWILLEVGPGRMLMSMARRHPQKAAAQMVLHSLPPPDAERSSAEVVLLTLGQLWAAGVEPDWDALHQREPRGRVPLPTYPFERQRYWIEPATATADPGERLAKHPDLSRWLYAPVWTRSQYNGAAQAGRAADAGEQAGSRWLLFLDGTGIAERIAESVRPFAHSVVTVAAAEGFARRGERKYALAPADPDGYLRLFEELQRADLLPDQIVHAYGLAPFDPDAGAQAPEGFYSLLYLAQALGPQTQERPVHIDVLVANANEVTGGETVRPEQAMLAGPSLVIPQEYAGVSCRLIDLDAAEFGGESGERLTQRLGEDLRERGGQDAAYRHGHRWVRGFEPVATQAPAGTPLRLRPDGVYLITGGLGGMGLTVADYLARQLPGARLALLGRSPLPPPEQWDAWLREHGDGGREGAMIAGLRALQALGAQAIYYSADVSDPQRLGAVVADVQRRLGPVAGLIHAAGVPGNGLIQLKTTQRADEVLAPKVAGTRALYAALSGQPLDFSILCSSRSALLGGLGSVDYCAANAYLDAFAHSRRKREGEFVVSVDWPAWQEVGMLVDSAAAHRARREPAARAGAAGRAPAGRTSRRARRRPPCVRFALRGEIALGARRAPHPRHRGSPRRHLPGDGARRVRRRDRRRAGRNRRRLLPDPAAGAGRRVARGQAGAGAVWRRLRFPCRARLRPKRPRPPCGSATRSARSPPARKRRRPRPTSPP
ncbi:type I polyketide synthase [Lysobacter enzymogenes]|nr:type I polyketide synthase [Lysobacter enzymogenes]UZW58368.1 type I polyketide synthase [Lysobacter enzymogenes]